MSSFICTACGTQYPESKTPPAQCLICEEERQYVPRRGQTWTTLGALAQSHSNAWREHEAGVPRLGTQPAFAIGQRAILLQTGGGNVLWDCVALLDAATVALIKSLGGIKAIAISHPAFLHDDGGMGARFRLSPFIFTPPTANGLCGKDSAIQLWDGGTLKLWDGVTLVRCGAHFAGGTVLHWAGGANNKRGLVCSGDILTVTTDRKWLSFMRSYPNFIPLSAREVETIGAALKPFSFDTICGHYFDRVIATDAKSVLEKSVARYVAAVEGKRGY